MTYPLALGYRSDGGAPTAVRPIADDTRFWPAGYVYTNAMDLTKFVLAIMNSGKRNGKQVVPATVVSRLLQSPVNVPTDEEFSNSTYGHGLFMHQYRGVKLFEHVGSMPGYSAHVWMVPEAQAAVLLLATSESARFRKTMSDQAPRFSSWERTVWQSNDTKAESDRSRR
jgi:CubicO group peptidase (beta-lactamase class C family)